MSDLETVSVKGFMGRRGTKVHFVPQCRRTVYLVSGGRIIPRSLCERERPARDRFRVVPWVEEAAIPPSASEAQGSTIDVTGTPKRKRRKAKGAE